MLSFPTPAVAANDGLAITSGGAMSSLSGVLVGGIVDMRDSNTYCNLIVAGRGFGSGPLTVGVQTSQDTTSGNFTDPTSGLPQFPDPFVSGGFVIIGSGPGALPGIFGSGYSGSLILSGFVEFAAFQRPHRYARVIIGSGFFDGIVVAGFVSQSRTTGSGFGFTLAPSSGTVSV